MSDEITSDEAIGELPDYTIRLPENWPGDLIVTRRPAEKDRMPSFDVTRNGQRLVKFWCGVLEWQFERIDPNLNLPNGAYGYESMEELLSDILHEFQTSGRTN